MGFIEFYAIAFLFYSLVWLGSVLRVAKSPTQALPDVVFGTLFSLMGILALSGLFLWDRFFPDGQYRDLGAGAGIFLTVFSLAVSSVFMFMIARTVFRRMANTITLGTFLGIQLVASFLFLAGIVVIV